ncbi:MAG: ParA family protein [Nitrospirae bacterium]|nr:ParA family protein [Nitrospirota bacterium]
MQRIIAIVNQKGGVSKTTTAVNVGAGLLSLNRKVLIVDLDPQSHCSYSLGVPVHEIKNTVYEMLKNKVNINNVIFSRGELKVIPSSLDMSAADLEFSNIPGREFLLKEALLTLSEPFDYILLDCPPSLSLITLNALTSATDIYIPLQTEVLALQGFNKLLETIELVKQRLNNNLLITGIVCTRYSANKKLNNEVIKSVIEQFGDIVFKTYIRENIPIAEAPSYGKTIFEYKPDSNGAKDYLNLCKEIITREVQQ